MPAEPLGVAQTTGPPAASRRCTKKWFSDAGKGEGKIVLAELAAEVRLGQSAVMVSLPQDAPGFCRLDPGCPSSPVRRLAVGAHHVAALVSRIGAMNRSHLSGTFPRRQTGSTKEQFRLTSA